ncbi:MAG: plasmid recombination protein [Prevotella sp.]|nr:plasmid recombination protein [Prevotella sp.]MBP3775950.1 plasmid recombination protein [Prevotella sp.]
MAGQKQVIDMKAGKRMSVAQSNEHLRVGADSAKAAKVAGTFDQTRTHLNFEIGKGGTIKEVDKTTSIPKRIKAIFVRHGIQDPNVGLSDEKLAQKRVGVRTHCNIILEGSRDTMRKLAFGNQQVNFENGSDNSHITRSPEIEKWAQDMYAFVARKYGEENIAAFVVHLDETLPHIHCTLVPITQSGKLSYREIFAGNDKYEMAERTRQLHNELAEINKKWGLERGESVAITGAQHKTYLQWLKDQISGNKKTIEEQSRTIDDQDQTITQQANTISDQKQQLYSINAEIKKADKRLKALTTMLTNLEAEKDNLEAQIAALEDEYTEHNEQFEQKRSELLAKLAEVEEKIADKTQKHEEAERKLVELAKNKLQLQKHYDELMREKVKIEPDVFEKVQREVNSTMWEEAAREMKKDFSAIENFLDKALTDRKMDEFKNLIEGTMFEDLAQRGEEIAAVAAALFLGYIDQATTFAHNSGGGGGPGGGWGRDKDEDDEAYRRRCCIMGRMMMRPAGRKQSVAYKR